MIFMVRQVHEKFRAKGKKLYFGFIGFEKAFGRVPREVLSWAMHKWLVSAIMTMYKGANKTVRTAYSNTECFADKVGMS